MPDDCNGGMGTACVMLSRMACYDIRTFGTQTFPATSFDTGVPSMLLRCEISLEILTGSLPSVKAFPHFPVPAFLSL